jgi:hypothetical protein
MKKCFFVFLMVLVMGVMLNGCGTGDKAVDSPTPSEDLIADASKNKITEETAYEGVCNYCHSAYDWSIAEDNPDIMYLEMGEETETEYQVIFRSYTGTFVYFHVDKSSGTTRLTEYVPSFGIEEDAGTIELYDYLT